MRFLAAELHHYYGGSPYADDDLRGPVGPMAFGNRYFIYAVRVCPYFAGHRDSCAFDPHYPGPAATLNRIREIFARRSLLVAGIAFFLLIALILIGASNGLSGLVRNRAIQTLKKTYGSDLQLKRLDVNLFPSVRFYGEALEFHKKDRNDLPPFITIEKFSATTSWIGVLRKRVAQVRLEGLRIHVPPRREKTSAGDVKSEKREGTDLEIDELFADGTILYILPRQAGKDPLQFDIHKLTLRGAGRHDAMSFQAVLRNAKPPGEIHSTGKFGPWDAGEPARTPVSGSYTFQNADLSVFRGIAGILSSAGKYSGVLDHINVEGNTDTPDFRVLISGLPVHLKTQFKAVVDGMDGDTVLDPVNAQFGRSSVIARGSVEQKPGPKGKTVSLDVTVEGGRLEDMLRLGVKADKPPMTGSVSFHTKLVIPPGEVDVAEKLQLDGAFEIARARFTELNVQEKVDTLSHRGRGETDDTRGDSVASNFRGRFLLKSGVMRFANLSFNVPGVSISLDGTYGLPDKRLDFHGTARLDAKLSQTTTGFKSFLLKALDPFFSKKKAGAAIPIKIGGTLESPSFGLSFQGGGK